MSAPPTDRQNDSKTVFSFGCEKIGNNLFYGSPNLARTQNCPKLAASTLCLNVLSAFITIINFVL